MLQMNHERAMNRLTDMLRNAQTVCTDIECFNGPCKLEIPMFFFLFFSKKYCSYFYSCLVTGQPNTGGGNTEMTNIYIMLAIWLGIALLLFLFRPRTLRNNRHYEGKTNNRVGNDVFILV